MEELIAMFFVFSMYLGFLMSSSVCLDIQSLTGQTPTSSELTKTRLTAVFFLAVGMIFHFTFSPDNPVLMAALVIFVSLSAVLFIIDACLEGVSKATSRSYRDSDNQATKVDITPKASAEDIV